MDTKPFKNGIFLSLMACFLGMAFLTNDVLGYHLFASLTVIFAACAFHHLSHSETTKYTGEKSHEGFSGGGNNISIGGHGQYSAIRKYERAESLEESGNVDAY
jgi:uncharacterized membrane protein YgcG